MDPGAGSATTVAADRGPDRADAGPPLLRRARTLILWALGAALVYSMVNASKGACPGGFGTDGFVDASGTPTDTAPQCITLALHPSPVVYLAIALTVIVAFSRAARAVDVETALRRLNRGAIVVVAIVVVSAAVSILWFAATPQPTTPGTVFFPFPFGSGTLTVAPLEPGPAG